MKKQLLKGILSILFLVGAASYGYGQAFNYFPNTSAVISGTYTDLGVNGTAITTANTDDANSAAENIGFTFNFNGKAFTQFVLNTNGFIKLGNVDPSAAALFGVGTQTITGSALMSVAPADTNIISAFNSDLIGGTAPEYRVFTSGIVGSRITTIQFKDLREKAATNQYAGINFQIRLYEASNIIEVVYGTFTASANADAFITTGVGLKGTDTTSLQTLFVRKGSTAAWNFATFGTRTSVTTQLFNSRKSVLPVSGITYQFRPRYQNDANVIRVQTMGDLPIPMGLPHPISAVVNNLGKDTLKLLQVNLAVTGANPFVDVQTVPVINPGASVTVAFATFTPANMGVNSFSVSVAPDNFNPNNSAVYRQNINADTYSYADTGTAFNAIGYNTGAGLILVKYHAAGDVLVTGVNVFLPTTGGALTGKTVYGVVLNSAGNIISQSANLVIAAGDIGKYYNFTIPGPLVSNDDFFVGLAQTAGTPGYFPVGMQQETSPTRAGAFFTAPLTATVAPTEAATFGRFMIKAVVTPSATSVADQVSNYDISVYPNPTSGMLYIQAGAIIPETVSVEVFDAAGKKVYGSEIKGGTSSSHSLDISRFPNGLYTVKIRGENQNTVEKIMLTR